MSSNEDLQRVVPAEEWRKQFGATVFRTKPAWEWFKRDHRRELVEAGALYLGGGRSQDLVHIDKIAAEVQRIRQAESIQRLNRCAA